MLNHLSEVPTNRDIPSIQPDLDVIAPTIAQHVRSIQGTCGRAGISSKEALDNAIMYLTFILEAHLDGNDVVVINSANQVIARLPKIIREVVIPETGMIPPPPSS